MIKSGTVKKCGYCKEEFYVPRYKLKDGKGKYCSKACSYKSRVKIKKLTNENWLRKESEIKTLEEIAKELHCNMTIVQYWRNKFDIHNKLNPWDRSEWKPKKLKRKDGYIRILLNKQDPYHRMADKAGHILEHRLVMAKHLGRCLETWEIIHHKNRIRDDNRIENLELIPSQNKHLSIIFMEKRIKELEERVSLLEFENQLLLEKVDNGKSKLAW